MNYLVHGLLAESARTHHGNQQSWWILQSSRNRDRVGTKPEQQKLIRQVQNWFTKVLANPGPHLDQQSATLWHSLHSTTDAPFPNCLTLQIAHHCWRCSGKTAAGPCSSSDKFWYTGYGRICQNPAWQSDLMMNFAAVQPEQMKSIY